MSHHQLEKFGIIYPESKNKGMWDLFMTFILLLTCFVTPLDIAFSKSKDLDSSLDVGA